MLKVKADHHLHCLTTMTCNSSWLVNNLIQFSRSYVSGGQLQVTPRLLYPAVSAVACGGGSVTWNTNLCSEALMAGESHRLQFHPHYLSVS